MRLSMDEINESSDVQENQGEFESYQEIGSEGEIYQDENGVYCTTEKDVAVRVEDLEVIPDNE